MSQFSFIKTHPGAENYPLFEELVLSIYEKNSHRFILGNDPVEQFLEGCYVLLKEKTPVGRFAFYENPELSYQDEKSACIGSYECIDDGEISNKLIDYAKELAKNKGYKRLIGPMEGSTWNNYRFSKNNDERNFFMEPFHHLYYNDQFINAGFKEIAEYISNLDTKVTIDTSKIDEYEKEYIKLGALFRTINMNDFENELEKIGQFSIDSFSDNFLYTPISAKDFVNKYRSLKTYFDPRMIWIVEDQQKQIQAIIFAIKDFLEPLNETFIIKSIVRRKNSPYKKIGSYLALKVVNIANNLGYKKVIHALMIKNNASVKISAKHKGGEYKSYALYALKIDVEDEY